MTFDLITERLSVHDIQHLLLRQTRRSQNYPSWRVKNMTSESDKEKEDMTDLYTSNIPDVASQNTPLQELYPPIKKRPPFKIETLVQKSSSDISETNIEKEDIKDLYTLNVPNVASQNTPLQELYPPIKKGPPFFNNETLVQKSSSVSESILP